MAGTRKFRQPGGEEIEAEVVGFRATGEHWNEPPLSVEVNEKLALVEFVGFAGFAVIVVSGAVVSTVQVKLAGVASVFPAASVAFTWKVWLPSARPL